MSALTQTSSTSLAPSTWALIQQRHFSANTFRANGQRYSVSVWATPSDNSVRATIYGTRSLGANARDNGRQYETTQEVGQIHINPLGEIVRFDVRPNGL